MCVVRIGAAPVRTRQSYATLPERCAQDLGEPRWGSSICGAWSSYRLPAGSSEYWATALVISLPYASSGSVLGESLDVTTTGACDREPVTGSGVRRVPPANASIATAIRISARTFTQLPPAARFATAVPRFGSARLHGACVATPTVMSFKFRA